jgi:hypothetical protein
MAGPLLAKAAAAAAIASHLKKRRTLPDGRMTFGRGSATGGKTVDPVPFYDGAFHAWTPALEADLSKWPVRPQPSQLRPGDPFTSAWVPISGIGWYPQIFTVPTRPCWIQAWQAAGTSPAWERTIFVIVQDGRRGDDGGILTVDIAAQNLNTWLSTGCSAGPLGLPVAEEFDCRNRWLNGNVPNVGTLYSSDWRDFRGSGQPPKIQGRLDFSNRWPDVDTSQVANGIVPGSIQPFDGGAIRTDLPDPHVNTFVNIGHRIEILDLSRKVIKDNLHVSTGDPLFDAIFTKVFATVVGALASFLATPAIGKAVGGVVAAGLTSLMATPKPIAEQNKLADVLDHLATSDLAVQLAAQVAKNFPVAPNASSVMPDGESPNALQAALALLSPDEREAYNLYVAHGLSPHDALLRVNASPPLTSTNNNNLLLVGAAGAAAAKIAGVI